MNSELQARIQQFRTEYLDTPTGQKHLAQAEAEADEVKQVLAEIRRKYGAGQDITDDVLMRLLPHNDNQHNRETGRRTSMWPCISKDVRAWLEGAGWKNPVEWTPTARLLFEAIDGLIQGNSVPWERFLASPYRKGFGAGFVSPILFCMDENYPVINSKVVKTYRYCTDQLGEPDEINARLEDYPVNAAKVKQLQRRLEPLGLGTIPEWDTFCHFMVSKRLGGGDLTAGPKKAEDTEYTAWLFVANPHIFQWQEAFDRNGVDWTGSKGAYPQKLLRQVIKAGDRVFGYQTGPAYEICCELVIAGDPYLTGGSTWAVDLRPQRWITPRISLSTLKSHPLLSELKFLQQTQISISGITRSQLEALDNLIGAHPGGPVVEGPVVVEKLGAVDQLILELRQAQHDTANPQRYEIALADAFEFLGFEAERVGGAGKPDVLIEGQLGADSYSGKEQSGTPGD